MIRYLVCFVISLGAAFAAADDAPPRPNIIFILADDLGPGDLACYGGKLAPTPNIDRMAAEGTRFEQYYSASPICSPSRVGCFTGMFPARWRINSFLQTRKGNAECEQADFLDPRAPSVARQLKSAGYATAHFGKWHMGGGRDVVDPPKFAAYGYDEHAGTWESPEPHPNITASDWIWSPDDKVKRWDRTAFFIDKTLDFVKRRQGQPAFINVWLDDVHTPWVPDEAAQGAQPRRDTPANLKKVIVEMDRQIGRLLAGLKELGVDKQTLVIFTSDNGALPTFRGDRSAGLRGSKMGLYEGGIRLPFIVRWHGHTPPDRVDRESVLAAVDLLPTFCKLATAKLPDGAALDGYDVSAALEGTTLPRKQPLFWEYGRNETSFRYPMGRDRSPWLAMREGPWKVLVNPDGSGLELYNVVTDRSESNDLASSQPEVAKQMSEALLAWKKTLPSGKP
jgi:arylsulfatase A-like enzyme